MDNMIPPNPKTPPIPVNQLEANLSSGDVSEDESLSDNLLEQNWFICTMVGVIGLVVLIIAHFAGF